MRLLPVVLLVGCAAPSEVAWLQSASYRWDKVNHRLSHLEWGVDDTGPFAAIIGGTSTTGVVTEIPDGCEGCGELPLLDDADVGVGWVRARSRRQVMAAGSVALVVDADGEEATAEIALPRDAEGIATAVIAGLAFDAREPLSGGDACYTPANGWHARRIAVRLGEPVVSGATARVPVFAAFEAGESLEALRTCIDDVNDQARLAVRVDVAVVAGPGMRERVEVAHAAEYALGDGGGSSPDPQPDPDLSTRAIGVYVSDVPYVTGWSALDWRFHEVVDAAQGRGAYLRSLSFVVDAGADIASGHATNYSPPTQLSGFDYRFAGTVELVEIDGTLESGVGTDVLPAELEDDGSARVFAL